MALTLYRKLTHEALSRIDISGKTLDLGGSRTSGYLKHLKGESKITVVNTDEDAKPDMLLDLEKLPYPFESGSYDSVLAINVLEHLWNWRELLKESNRVLVSGGKLIAVVPFLHAVHPSPHDYCRYTKEALVKACFEAGYTAVEVNEVGMGVFVSAYSFFQRFLPSFGTALLEPVAVFSDTALAKGMALLKRKYSPEDYPLGYIVIARKAV